MREWMDKATGRAVRQLTDFPGGASLNYFRMPRRTPGGWILAWSRHAAGDVLLIRPEDGAVRPLALRVAQPLKLDERTGTLWYVSPHAGSSPAHAAAAPNPVAWEIWGVDLPDGSPRRLAELPPDVPGQVMDITCDGRTAILQESFEDVVAYPIPPTKEPGRLWHYLNRPRWGRMWAYALDRGARTLLDEPKGMLNSHHDTSPNDPGLLRYALDMCEGLGQRMWTIRTDGTGRTPIRLQEKFEVITHEFWWPGGRQIAFVYQDRRRDPTFFELPWCEYSPAATRFGLAGLDGRQQYLSDPLNHYHSHLFVSGDGQWLCGEGTDGHSFVYAAPFSEKHTRVDFTPLATVHTPYVPFRGQHVEAGFSHDNRWLVYNDTIEGCLQVCAVRVEA